jgi:general secretion pathway protein H
MRISVPGICKPVRRPTGFTLIELVLVLALVGVVLAVTVVSAFPGDAKTLRTEAERLAQLWALAYDEVQLNGQTIVWEADAQGYRFLRREGARLSPISDDQVLRPRLWPLQPMQWRNEPAPALRSDSGRLQLALERSGSGDAFRLELAHGEWRATVRGDGMGNFRADD